MKAGVLKDSRNSFQLLCKWKKYFFKCKISKMFVNVKRQNFTERPELNRKVLVLERAINKVHEKEVVMKLRERYSFYQNCQIAL